MCAFVILAGLGRPFWLPFVGPFVIWPASSLLRGTRLGRWLVDHARASVFLFMIHGLMLLTLKAMFPGLYNSDYEFVVWLTLPVFVAIVSQGIYVFLERFTPAFLTVLLGGRKPRAEKVSGAGA